jgi:hypothetical protein
MDPVTRTRHRRSFEEETAESRQPKSQVGPSARQVAAAQRAAVGGGGAASLGKTAAAEVTAQVFEVGAEALATTAGRGLMAIGWVAAAPIYVAYKHLDALYKAIQEGDELKDAHARDAINLAFVWAASKNLPPGYVQRMMHEYRAVSGEHGGASKLLTRMMVDDGNWQAIKSEAEQRVQGARSLARKQGIETPQKLANRLNKDPVFARAYNSDLAVRHGVDSVVYEGPRAKRAH